MILHFWIQLWAKQSKILQNSRESVLTWQMRWWARFEIHDVSATPHPPPPTSTIILWHCLHGRRFPMRYHNTNHTQLDISSIFHGIELLPLPRWYCFSPTYSPWNIRVISYTYTPSIMQHLWYINERNYDATGWGCQNKIWQTVTV